MKSGGEGRVNQIRIRIVNVIFSRPETEWKMTSWSPTVGCTLISKSLLSTKGLVRAVTSPTSKAQFTTRITNGCQSSSCSCPLCFTCPDAFGSSWRVGWWNSSEKERPRGWLRSRKKKGTNWLRYNIKNYLGNLRKKNFSSSRKTSTTNTISTILASSFAKFSTLW